MATKLINVEFLYFGAVPMEAKKCLVTTGEALIEAINIKWNKITQSRSTGKIFVINDQQAEMELEVLKPAFDTLTNGCTIRTFFTFSVLLEPYGSGIGGTATKTPFGELVLSSNTTLDELQAEAKNVSHWTASFQLVRKSVINGGNLGVSVPITNIKEVFEQITEVTKKRKGAGQGGARKKPNLGSDTASATADEPEIKSRTLYLVKIHSSYSGIVYPQLASSVNFVDHPNFNLEPEHHATLTAAPSKSIGAVDVNGVINDMKNLVPMDTLKSDATYISGLNMLQALSANSAAKSGFSEKIRRSIIDIILLVAINFVNTMKLLGNVEQELEMEEPLVESEVNSVDIIGSGPLDYIITTRENAALITSRTNEEDVEVLSKEENASPEYVEGAVDVESKVRINDSALYQTVAQCHDAMFVTKDKVFTPAAAPTTSTSSCATPEQEVRLECKRPKVTGILSTGHTWEIYTMSYNKATHKGDFRFHGKKTIKVLRYLDSQRTSSFRFTDPNDKAQVSETEYADMVYLALGVLLGKF